MPTVTAIHASDRAGTLERPEHRPRLLLAAGEVSGSLGDLGTFLPLALALTATGTLDFGTVFIFAGIANVVSGWCFRQPVPVQPMKALAAVAITEQLTAGEIAAAGWAVAAVVFVFAAVGAIEHAARLVPKPLVRAIQLGIGLRLIFKGLEWILGVRWAGLGLSFGQALPWIGPDSLIVAACAAGLLCVAAARRIPLLLPVFAAGMGLAVLATPDAAGFQFAWPRMHLVWPTAHEWGRGALQAGLPQLPLTLLNSVVAVCALSSDYFPGAGIRPRRMALNVGAMNLLALPLGAMPMCHGAGGLAAQYRFGGRTGFTSILLGAMMIATALLAGPSAAQLLSNYPTSILGVMLILAGWTLAGIARDCLAPRSLAILIPTVACILVFDTARGFLIGAAIAGVLQLTRTRLGR